MIKSSLKTTLLCFVAVALAIAPASLRAQETNHTQKLEKKAAGEGSKKAAGMPFHGKLKAIDKTAKTITYGETTLQITSETKIEKNGKPARLEDGVVGEPVAGNYKKADDGKMNALKVRFGAKPEDTAKPKKEKAKKSEKKEN